MKKICFLTLFLILFAFNSIYAKVNICNNNIVIYSETINFREKLSRAKKRLLKNPKSFNDLIEAGSCSRALKLNDESCSYYAKALEIKPGNLPSLKALTEIYYLTKKFDKTIILCSKALIIHPKQCEFLFTMALAQYNANHYLKSLKNFQKFIELNPKDEDALYNITLIYLKLNDFNNADLYLDKILSLNPLNNNALIIKDYISNIKKSTNQFASRALLFNPNNLSAIFLEGLFELSNGNFPQALNNFSKLSVQIPYESDFWLCYSAALYNANDIQNSIKAIDMAQKNQTIQSFDYG